MVIWALSPAKQITTALLLYCALLGLLIFFFQMLTWEILMMVSQGLHLPDLS